MTDVAVVGGGSGALGGAVCARLLAASWAVIVPVRHAEAAGIPPGADSLQCDLADAGAAQSLAAAAAARGTWRAAISCLGGFRGGRAHEVDDGAVRDQLEANLLAPWRLLRAAATAMIGAGTEGRLVTVVSRAALDVAGGQAPYQVSKAAALRLVEVMAVELARHRIGVDAVLPGTMDTPANRASMPKADRHDWLSLDGVAEVIAGLLRDPASLTGRAVVLPPLRGQGAGGAGSSTPLSARRRSARARCET
jgi:NAD(P)-dependent dehydrogenase (short-subunit alcohol dehydrogenase family)